eukprot:2498176-Amphidinium_carterae.6
MRTRSPNSSGYWAVRGNVAPGGVVHPECAEISASDELRRHSAEFRLMLLFCVTHVHDDASLQVAGYCKRCGETVLRNPTPERKLETRSWVMCVLVTAASDTLVDNGWCVCS